MGILNLSPDSFYEGSRAGTQAQALEMAEKLIGEGADILDVGAESSRPGSRPNSAELEIDRLLPFVTRVCKQYNVPVSVDTCKPEVAKRVLDAGVQVINDITGLQKHPDMAKIIAPYNAGVVLMHMQCTPETMQKRPHYHDLFGEVLSYLKKSMEIAEAAGIASDRLVVDPGIGFGKTTKHNLQLIGQLDRLKVLNKPIPGSR